MTPEQYLVEYSRRLDEIDRLTRRIGEHPCTTPVPASTEFGWATEWTGEHTCIEAYKAEHGKWVWTDIWSGLPKKVEETFCAGCLEALALIRERKAKRRSLGAFRGAMRRAGQSLREQKGCSGPLPPSG